MGMAESVLTISLGTCQKFKCASDPGLIQLQLRIHTCMCAHTYNENKAQAVIEIWQLPNILIDTEYCIGTSYLPKVWFLDSIIRENMAYCFHWTILLWCFQASPLYMWPQLMLTFYSNNNEVKFHEVSNYFVNTLRANSNLNLDFKRFEGDYKHILSSNKKQQKR